MAPSVLEVKVVVRGRGDINRTNNRSAATAACGCKGDKDVERLGVERKGR